MASLLLDTANNDLTVDALGNIALADLPYATAQDVACTLRLFSGELWYDASQGLPYIHGILGQRLSPTYLKATFVAAAKTVPGVASATAVITGFSERVLAAQVQVTLVTGQTVTLQTGTGMPPAWYATGVSP